MKQASTHRSLERGLAVLEHVAAARRPASLVETARRIGLHRSTAHHLMQTLVSAGYLRQEKATRGYELTAKLYRLTARLWSIEQLGEMAQPFLEELTRATGEGTSVATWIDGAVRIAAKREAEGPVRVVQDVNAARPLYCTAVGKALAAWLPRAEVDAALRRTRMERLTPRRSPRGRRSSSSCAASGPQATRWTTKSSTRACGASRCRCSATPAASSRRCACSGRSSA
jgi:DNA-binding IclR family transcriptional regulator